MTPELWEKVSAALDQLLDLSEPEQAAFLATMRLSDPIAADEVESLLGQKPAALLEALPDPLREEVQSTRIRSRSAALGLQAEPPPLQQIGPYRVEGELARGGMGIVWRVEDTTFGRTLAVKMLLPEARRDPSAEKRFLQEAKITGRLQHPGIPPIHDLGRLEDGTPFFTMKLIEGKTLAALIQQAGTAQFDAGLVGIFEQICRTIAYAHSQGILHRDLKPSNVMVGAFGEVQVMDWGLAKPLVGGQIGRSSVRTVAAKSAEDTDSFTLAGDVMGTPAYMAPEQARGEIERLDERCDVFGLGGVLCAMLLGRAPFVGTHSQMARLASSGDLTETFALLDGCSVDPELVAIAKKCLAPDPADRYRNGGEVADAVTQHREGAQQKLAQAELARAKAQVQALEERRRRKLSIGLFAAVFALVVTAGGIVFWRQTEQQRQRQEQAQRDLAEARQLAETLATKDRLNREVTTGMAAAKQFHGDYERLLADPSEAALLISDFNRWESALGAFRQPWREASASVSANRTLADPKLLTQLEQLGEQVAIADKAFALARKLDQIRLDSAARTGGWFDTSGVAQQYAAAFREDLGINVAQAAPEQIAAEVRKSPIRFALVASLDHWALAREQDAKIKNCLLEALRQADPNPIRNEIRDLKLWDNRELLQAKVDALQPAEHAPPFLAAVGERMLANGDNPQTLLQAALLRYPRDFWLNLLLGMLKHSSYPGRTQFPSEAIGYFRAALAVRADHPGVYVLLGFALSSHGDQSAAISVYQRALELSPQLADAHALIGIAYSKQNKLEAANREFQTALEKTAANNNRLAGWIHYQQGLANYDEQPPAAAESFRKATASDPQLADAHYRLGRLLLLRLEDTTGAIPALQTALKLQEKESKTHLGEIHFLLGAGHFRQQEYARAIASYLTAIELNPADEEYHYELGKTYLALGNPAAAEQEFAAGIQKLGGRTNYPFWDLQLGLGRARELQGKFAAALAHWDQFRGYSRWSDLNKKMYADCQARQVLDERLPGQLSDDLSPPTLEECAKWAEFCAVYKRLPVAAVRFYRWALELDPTAGEKRIYPAVLAAVAAGDGNGHDAGGLSPLERAEYRSLALGWLQQRLARIAARQKEAKVDRASFGETRTWENDPRLATVRDAPFLDHLPVSEQDAWRELWRQAAELGPGRLAAGAWPSNHKDDGKTRWVDHQLQLQIPQGGKGYASSWNNTPIRGDFIADAEFNIVSWKDEPPTKTPYLRFYVASQPGHHAPDFLMFSRQADRTYEGFSGFSYSQEKWKTRPTIPHSAKRGVLRIRRQGNDWDLYFRPQGAAVWMHAATYFLEMPDEIYLGLSFGIQDGTAAGPMEAEVLRVRVTPVE